MDRGQKQLWAAITISAGSPTHRLAQQAVLANSLEMTLEGEALNPMTKIHFRFRAKGQLVNGRVGKDIKADFKCTELVVEETP
jgi:hypothetical protein